MIKIIRENGDREPLQSSVQRNNSNLGEQRLRKEKEPMENEKEGRDQRPVGKTERYVNLQQRDEKEKQRVQTVILSA